MRVADAVRREGVLTDEAVYDLLGALGAGPPDRAYASEALGIVEIDCSVRP